LETLVKLNRRRADSI